MLRHGHGAATLFFKLLLTGSLPLCTRSIGSAMAILSSTQTEHSTSALQSAAAGPAAAPLPPIKLGDAVMRRGIEELAMAQSAHTQAREMSGYAAVTQQELIASHAIDLAQEPYKKVAPLVPEAKAQGLKVRKYAFLAAQHARHTAEVEFGFRKISDVAVDEARKAVLGWIKADADTTAKHTASVGNNKMDRLANAVAAAAEPYHLALLRNQKFCEETYAKAKTAYSSFQKLATKAKQVALDGQQFQAGGLGVDGQVEMNVAVGMIQQAENLRKWASKLYTQANTACSTAGGYTLAEQQAATNAAMTTIINEPMKLPTAL